MDLYLIRHGECFKSTHEYFDSEMKTMNPPLTEKGIKQAEKLASACSNIKFDAIISSDLTRAVQTAEIINKASPSVRIINSAFREIDMGEIFTKPWDEFPEIYSKWLLHDEDIPYPNGENGGDVWKRCKTHIKHIVESQYKSAALVCHGGTIRSIVCGVLGIPQQKRFSFGSPLENCSVTIIKFAETDKNFYLQTFNDYSHLTDLQKPDLRETI